MEKLREHTIINQIITQIKSLPPPKTEESILFRVLVQSLVIIGIIATDVAAKSSFLMSFWAIPLSIVGAAVSWRRRKKRNIGLKFGLAIAMIATLVIFLGNLLENIFDNRLVLAEFLVQLQVIHSFDLPRRKDLGYSMVIGLILIAVAGTLSQTIAFAPWLFLFLVIAIPTLVLDYRSRLNLPRWETEWKQRHNTKINSPQQQWLQNSSLSPRKLGWFLLIVIILGLLIFAMMPRYPGYKLQTFPVSAPEELQNRNFSRGDRGIINPGYDRDGNGSAGGLIGENGGGADGAQQIDDTFYYGFNTKINQNLRGGITNKKIVLRIRSQAPGFWRVLAFDHYTGQGWEISRDSQTLDLSRNPWTYQFSTPFPNLKGGSKKIIQTYTVVSDLPNIIPVLNYPQAVYFPTKQIAIDPEGNLRSPAGLIEDLTYTTISRVPYRSRSKLRTANINYPSLISKYYLQIPAEIKDKVKTKAEELLAKSNNPLESNYEKALYLAQAIKQNYMIKTDIALLAEDEDLAEAFLYRDEGGYHDHFATVYTLMLRSLDIPARLVVGFAPGQFNPFTGYYVVHNTDAYAMTEVYFPNYGWFYFDPLPGHEIIPVSFEQENTFGVVKQLWNWVAGWLPSPVTSFLTVLFSNVFHGIFNFLGQGWLGKIWKFLTGSFIGILVGILGLITLAFLGWLGWLGVQNLRYRRQLAKLHPVAKLYRNLLDLLKDKGYPKHPAQTPTEYAQHLAEFIDKEPLAIIELISNSYTAWRYGNQTPNLDYLQSQFLLLNNNLSKTGNKQKLIT